MIWFLYTLYITKVIKYIAIGIGIGISNFVADILVIGILVKTNIGAPLVSCFPIDASQSMVLPMKFQRLNFQGWPVDLKTMKITSLKYL